MPASVELTENVTTPLALDGPEAAEIVSFPARFEVRLTVLPTIGFKYESRKVTVIIEFEVPFAIRELVEAF